MIRYNRKNRTLILQLPNGRDRRVVLLVGFIIAINVLVSYIDLPLAIYMSNIDPGIDAFFRRVTLLGDSKYYLVPLALVLPFIMAARQAIAVGSVRRILSWSASAITFLFVSVAGSGLLNNLIKIIVGRTRPTMWLNPDNWVDGQGIYGFAPFTLGDNKYHSMPSGHADTAFAMALALSFFLPKKARLPLLILASVIAFSRVVITAHFLSDTLLGVLLGLATTYWLRDYVTRRGWIFVKRGGEYRPQAPGYLLGQKIRALLWNRLGLPDGARGRLP